MLKSDGRWVDTPPEYRTKKTLYNRFGRLISRIVP